MGLDDLARRGQAKARPPLLRGKERLEDLAQHLGRHPLARVDQAQAHGAPAVHPLARRLNRQFAAAGHGLLGVEQEVQERLFEHLLIQADRRQVGGQVALDVDVGRARRRAEEVVHLLDDLGDVRGQQVEVLDAGEAQEVVGHLDEALAFVLQALDAGQGAALALGLRVLEILGQKLQVQPERAEVVLDLVNEAAGQLGQLGVLVAHGP